MGDNENRQKIKLLKLYELLLAETDNNHAISRMELCRRLNEMDISSNVRTLSLDIRTLQDNGYEIMSCMSGKEKYYYVPERQFSPPEMKLLIDAVQAATFITEKKTEELIGKIAALGGNFSAMELRQSLVYFNTGKHTNEHILYNIDAIHEGIRLGRKVEFNYFDLDENRDRVFRTDETGQVKRYVVDPLALVHNEDNYYLMAFSQHHPDCSANYRVDRMIHVNVLNDESISNDARTIKRRLRGYSGRLFKMYNGSEKMVTLRFRRRFIGAVYDKFGENTKIVRVDDDLMETRVSVNVSPTFFGWVAQFGGEMTITSPDNVVGDFHAHMRAVIENAVKNDIKPD